MLPAFVKRQSFPNSIALILLKARAGTFVSELAAAVRSLKILNNPNYVKTKFA